MLRRPESRRRGGGRRRGPPYSTSTRLRFANPLPTNATFNSETGLFRWTTVEVDGPSTNRFTVIAEDASDSNVWVSAVVTVRVSEVNSTLSYKSPTAFYLWRNEPFAVNLRYEDADLPPNRLSFFIGSGPAGLTLDSSTGRLQWQPGNAQTGTFTCNLLGYDNAGGMISTPVKLYVDTAPFTASTFAPAGASGHSLQWKSKRNATYTVQWCSDIAAPNWQPLNAEAPLTGNNAILSYTISPAAFGAPTNAFFRIIQTRD